MILSAAGSLAAFGGFIVIGALLIGILWILIPFAVFGIKPLLQQLLTEQRKTNECLTRISQQIYGAAQVVTQSPAEKATGGLEAVSNAAPDPRTLSEIMASKSTEQRS